MVLVSPLTASHDPFPPLYRSLGPPLVRLTRRCPASAAAAADLVADLAFPRCLLPPPRWPRTSSVPRPLPPLPHTAALRSPRPTSFPPARVSLPDTSFRTPAAIARSRSPWPSSTALHAKPAAVAASRHRQDASTLRRLLLALRSRPTRLSSCPSRLDRVSNLRPLALLPLGRPLGGWISPASGFPSQPSCA